MKLLQVRHLRVRYPVAGPVKAWLTGLESRHIDAVLDVSLEVEQGTTLAIVGESGSGKSSLARAIVGLTPIAGGTVEFDGRNPFAEDRHGARAYHREVAMMFQDPVSSLSPRRTVRALITEPFIVHGMKDRDLGAEARRLLGLVGLPPDFTDRYPHQLSGGQARRVGVARAIALNPKLIIADEPTAGLDVSVQGEILNLLARLQGEFGLTYVIITHNLAVVRHVSDETAIMYMGRLVERGRTADIFAHPAHPYTRALIAAQPNPDPARRRRDVALLGEVGSLRHRPPGCEFHPRCPLAQELCRASEPATRAVSAHRECRCHFPLTELPAPVTERTASAFAPLG
jgi:oligopeptide/dipeptide ABC transporter ATP-binding protein